MKNQNNEEEEKREFQYVYFIENHIVTSKVNLELQTKDNKEVGYSELVKQDYFNQNNMEFIYSIFHFRNFSSIIRKNLIRNNDKNIFNVDIILNDLSYGKNLFIKTIEIRDINNNNFLFDFRFEASQGWIFKRELSIPVLKE